MHPRDLKIEAELAGQIRAALEQHNDEDLTIDMVEGETSLFELIDTIMADDAADDERLAGIKARQDELKERKARIDRRQSTRRSVVHAALDTAGLRKIERAEYTVSLRAVPQGVEVIEPELLSDEYVRIKRDPDKAAIKAALKAGVTIPGAALTNGGETVSVRRR